MSELDPIEIEVPLKGKVSEPDIDIGAEPTKVEPSVPEPQNKAEDGIELLKRQLEDKRREAEEARRQKIEAEKIARQREEEAYSYKTQINDSQHVALTNAIATYERDAEMLERDYATLLEQGDYQKAAKVQRQMAQIEARLSTLQQGREELEYRAQQPVQRVQPEPSPVQQMPRDAFEERIAGLSSASQQWVRANRHIVDDPKSMNRLSAAHFNAVAEDIQVDTPEYFNFLEQQLGMKGQNQAVNASKQHQSRMAMAAAPVSRSSSVSISGNGRVANVTLTPAEREMARDMDIDEDEYAANKLYYIQTGRLMG